MVQGTDPWSIREQDFPQDADWTARIRFLIGYAVLAPSGHNAQPWLFRLRKNCVELYADRTRALPVADPDDRELTISCGCALLNLRLALRRYGLRGETVVFPEPDDPDLLATVRPGNDGPASGEELALFGAIPKRRTSRRRFEAKDVPQDAVAALAAAASAEGAWLAPVTDARQRDGLADLIADGDRRQASDRAFRREMAAWAHPHRARTRDGLPGYAYGVGDLDHFVGATILRTFESAPGHAAEGREVAQGSPLLAVLGTADDAPESWMAAGQSLERVLLKARTLGLHASYLNQPVEIPELRTRVREVLGLSGTPQLVLRFGYGEEVSPTPRRSVDDVILTA